MMHQVFTAVPGACLKEPDHRPSKSRACEGPLTTLHSLITMWDKLGL